MKTPRRMLSTRSILTLGLLFLGAQGVSTAQTPPAQGACKITNPQGVKPDAAPAPDLTGGIRLTVNGGDDCDSLYCPEYEAEYAEAVKTVPEFKKAYEDGIKKYRNQKLALRWLMVNFPLKNVRTDYYKRKKAWLEQAAGKAGKVTSAMTDEKGVAIFTELKLRTYYVSNLVPLEDGNILWNCAVTVPPPVPRQLYSVTVEFSAPKATAAAATK
ncbi:MAG: hypothetical protein LC802_16245 [Acidobacteria bacterium]|nr:hypothetical protein [Acidobacteriota bacterium]